MSLDNATQGPSQPLLLQEDTASPTKAAHCEPSAPQEIEVKCSPQLTESTVGPVQPSQVMMARDVPIASAIASVQGQPPQNFVQVGVAPSSSGMTLAPVQPSQATNQGMPVATAKALVPGQTSQAMKAEAMQGHPLPSLVHIVSPQGGPSDLEIQHDHNEVSQEEEPTSTLNYLKCVYNAFMHLLSLVFMVKTGLFPVFDADDVDKIGEDALAYQNVNWFLTLVFGPLVIFQTASHWYRGTYFPMTSADSFYTVRFRRSIDNNPQRIFYGTIWAMMGMATFYITCSSLNLLFGFSAYVNMDTMNLSTVEAWQVRVNFFLQLLSVVSLLKRYMLVYLFLFCWLNFLGLLGTLTCGYGFVVMCIFGIRGFDADSEVCNVSLRPLHSFIAFFYRNL